MSVKDLRNKMKEEKREFRQARKAFKTARKSRRQEKRADKMNINPEDFRKAARGKRQLNPGMKRGKRQMKRGLARAQENVPDHVRERITNLMTKVGEGPRRNLGSSGEGKSRAAVYSRRMKSMKQHNKGNPGKSFPFGAASYKRKMGLGRGNGMRRNARARNF